jgi:ADP-ribose pyrophosphatase YjhB (NUDIX family)
VSAAKKPPYRNSVKIDPLRGKCKEKETPEEAATRELYEESRGLFDLRDSKTTEFLQEQERTDGIYHLRVEFEAISPSAEVTPLSLIEEYRNNRRELKGCNEVLDLAIEPKSRIQYPEYYPRLASQTKTILADHNLNLDDKPTISLYRKHTAGLTIYSSNSTESWNEGVEKLLPKSEMFHPLLLNCPKWELWIIEHDRRRAAKTEEQCFVSRIDSTYKFMEIDKQLRAFDMADTHEVRYSWFLLFNLMCTRCFRGPGL